MTFFWGGGPSILVTFLVETEHFSGKNEAFKWSKQATGLNGITLTFIASGQSDIHC